MNWQNLIKGKAIGKVKTCYNGSFISPIVVRERRDQSINLALDPKVFSKEVNINKYRMQASDTNVVSFFNNLVIPRRNMQP